MIVRRRGSLEAQALETLAVAVLVLYLAVTAATSFLLLRRRQTSSLWLAFVPLLNIVVLADLTGVTHTHRFDGATQHSPYAEMARDEARTRSGPPPWT